MLPIKGLLSLLTLSRRDITTVIIFAVAIGMLSLVVPIAAQGLVTIVSFGALRQPLVVLAIVVFVLLGFSGVLRVLQHVLLETVQQRLFASIALKLANRLPKIDMATLDENHGSEVLNKFFDVMTIQKTMSDILLSVSAFALQALLGMLLLALYHPALLAFDIVFIFILLLVILVPYQKGVKTACIESDAKYAVVDWLEELARVPLLFHFQNHAAFGFEKADQMVVKYIKARQAHYKVILQHMVGAYGLQALASTALFVIGGLLVLKNQMTLGQLVAAEIVITTLGASAAKMPRYLEKFYDLRAAAEKVNSLLKLPTERFLEVSHPLLSYMGPFSEPPSIKVKNLVFLDGDNNKNKINFTIEKGSSLAVSLLDQNGRDFFVDTLVGLRPPHSGEIQYNKISLQNYPLDDFRKKISLIRHAECFDGTILENIMIGNPSTSLEDIINLLNEFSIGEFISSLPEGLNFPLYGSCRPFSYAQLMKLAFIREIVNKPYFLVVDEALDIFPLNQVNMILEIMRKYCGQFTLLVKTRRTDILDLFDNRINL